VAKSAGARGLAGNRQTGAQAEIDALKSVRLTTTISIHSRFKEPSHSRGAKETSVVRAFPRMSEIVALKSLR
jgi:hypothetical protein